MFPESGGTLQLERVKEQKVFSGGQQTIFKTLPLCVCVCVKNGQCDSSVAEKQIPDAEEFVLTGNFVCVNKRQGHENSTKHKHHRNTERTNLEMPR